MSFESARNAAAIIDAANIAFSPVSPNIRRQSEHICQHPELVEGMIGDLDMAVSMLNTFIIEPQDEVGIRPVLFQNSSELAERMGYTGRFPTLSETLASGKDSKKRKDALMHARKQIRRGVWEFQEDISDPRTLIDAVAIEIYASLLANEDRGVFSDLSIDDSMLFVCAIEEMLAVSPTNQMAESVKEWYSVGDGFSQELVDVVNGRVPTPFVKGQVLRSTEHFLVVDGYKEGMENQPDGERWFIQPRTDWGEMELAMASQLHKINMNLETHKMRNTGVLIERQVQRADRSAVNMMSLFGPSPDIPGQLMRHDLVGKGIDTVPSVSGMERAIRLGPPYMPTA